MIQVARNKIYVQQDEVFWLRQSEEFKNITDRHTGGRTDIVTSWASCRRQKSDKNFELQWFDEAKLKSET